MKYVRILIYAMVLITFAVAVYIYPQLPERMASHWNAAGEADGWTSRFWGVFLLPIMSLAMMVIFLLIPRIDPLKSNIEKFRGYFDWFILVFLGFFFYLYLLTLAWNLGYRFDMTRWLLPAFAGLFYYLGVMMKHAEPNWFIGIRTPWTLSSPVVWQKTHQLGAKVYQGAAIISLIGLAFPKYTIWFILAPVMIGSLWLVIYSYLEFRKEKK